MATAWEESQVVAGISISGLAAMALSRPIAAKTQVVRNAYDASKEKILEGIWEGFVLSPILYTEGRS